MNIIFNYLVSKEKNTDQNFIKVTLALTKPNSCITFIEFVSPESVWDDTL